MDLDHWATEPVAVIHQHLAKELVEASSLSEEASPAVSGDGLTLWVASRREPTVGGMDIWRVTRPKRGGTSPCSKEWRG